MGKLAGKVVAVTGPRCAEEFSLIVGKMGGEPLVCPAQGTVFTDDSLFGPQLLELTERPVDWFVLTTGIGTEALVNKAEALGYRDRLLEMMRQSRIAARGYKTVNALRKLGLEPAIRDDDGTAVSLYRLITEEERGGLVGKRLAVQLYGDPQPRVLARFREAGAECVELLPYVHVMPDPEPIDRLIGGVIAGRIDAVVFTSTAQVRCVARRAEQTGQARPLLGAFAGAAAAVAVGKVTAEALREEGVSRVVVPEDERLGPALLALGRQYEER